MNAGSIQMLRTVNRNINGSIFSCSFSRYISSKQLVYSQHGDPHKVLNLQEIELNSKLKPSDIRVKFLASTINPADVNQVQGVYPIKPPLPAIGGNETVGEVIEVGENVTEFVIGDWVIPSRSGIGTWRMHADLPVEDFIKVDKNLPFEAAATLQVNPPTAYRMLKDFVDLKPGDLIAQNGANSAVGRAVIQIAHALGFRTANIIRDRVNSDKLVAELKLLGADEVYTEEQMVKGGKNKIKNARLALNCVGGRSSLLLASCLNTGGIIVTYGGMSKLPVQAPTGPFIFKDIKLMGFWMSRWYNCPENKRERNEMLENLTNLVRSGKFRPPDFNKVKLENWQEAMTNAMNSSKKQMFIF